MYIHSQDRVTLLEFREGCPPEFWVKVRCHTVTDVKFFGQVRA